MSDTIFREGTARGIQAKHATRLRLQLGCLEHSSAPTDTSMAVLNCRLHSLKGRDEGRWSIWVDGAWRLTFAFDPDKN